MSFPPAPSRPVILCDNQPLTRDAVAEQLRSGFATVAADKLSVSETEVLSWLARDIFFSCFITAQDY